MDEKEKFILLFFQRLETRGQGQATFDRGLGLGSNVEERFHGLSLLRDIGAYQSARQRLVQTAHPRGGGILQRTCSGGGCRSGRIEDEDASTFIYLTDCARRDDGQDGSRPSFFGFE